MALPFRLYLAGPAGCGKTAVAEALGLRHGLRCVSLGDACRAECRRLCWPEDRAALQAAGDRLRCGDPAGVLRAAGALDFPGPLVVDGVRLAAEGFLLRDRGFLGVRVDAPAAVRAARLAARDGSAAVPDHPTEREAVPADIWLYNAGTDPEALGRAVPLLAASLALHEAGVGRGRA